MPIASAQHILLHPSPQHYRVRKHTLENLASLVPCGSEGMEKLMRKQVLPAVQRLRCVRVRACACVRMRVCARVCLVLEEVAITTTSFEMMLSMVMKVYQFKHWFLYTSHW